MDIDLQGYIRQERSKRNKALRDELMAKDPHCHWCGCLLDNSPQAHIKNMPKGYFAPDNMATIEHLYDRLEIEKRYRDTNNRYKVLACYKCNHLRGRMRMKSLPKELLEKRKQLLLERKLNNDHTPRPIILLKAKAII